jgi:hypothetical protein
LQFKTGTHRAVQAATAQHIPAGWFACERHKCMYPISNHKFISKDFFATYAAKFEL